ncbi:MAG TPA: phosphatase PAP2 family protein [Trebonia sp.]|nr:phosphatase PAP2 family protein [Trebonia sp.]
MDSGGMRGRASRPLLATAALRRWAWALLAAGIAVAVALGLAFARQCGPDRFDRAADAPVIDSLGRHQALAGWLTQPGNRVPFALITLALAAACLWARRWNGLVLALVADLIATGVDDKLLKPLFHRTYLGALSYPSGHTTSVATLALVYAVLFLAPPQDRRSRGWRLAGLAVLLALLVAAVLGVLALRWHYFTDTVGGAAIAVAVTAALCLAIDALWPRAAARWQRRQPG